MNDFWCISVFFNPAGFKSLLNNYYLFSEKLKRQNSNLLTVELTFGDDKPSIKGDNVIHLHSNSIMWQKERLINYAVSMLPNDCKMFAWIDCDVVFKDDNWTNLAIDKLQNNDIIQLFKRVYYLPKNHETYCGKHISMLQGVVWQKNIHRNWLIRRKEKDLPFSSPGFAWAARRDAFEHCEGIYDKNIIGSGDTFLVDCYFDSWEIHGYASKFNCHMKKDMMSWRDKFRSKNKKIDYIPMDIFHLWHGSLKNRRYMDRHDIVLKYKYNPETDIKLENNVYEWNSDKQEMHEDIKNYFHLRKEDDA